MECASALQIFDVSHRQNDLINGYCLGFKIQNNTLLFHGFCTKYEVKLRLTTLVILNHIRF
jgi:hypothetical protein